MGTDRIAAEPAHSDHDTSHTPTTRPAGGGGERPPTDAPATARRPPPPLTSISRRPPGADGGPRFRRAPRADIIRRAEIPGYTAWRGDAKHNVKTLSRFLRDEVLTAARRVREQHHGAIKDSPVYARLGAAIDNIEAQLDHGHPTAAALQAAVANDFQTIRQDVRLDFADLDDKAMFLFIANAAQPAAHDIKPKTDGPFDGSYPDEKRAHHATAARHLGSHPDDRSSQKSGFFRMEGDDVPVIRTVRWDSGAVPAKVLDIIKRIHDVHIAIAGAATAIVAAGNLNALGLGPNLPVNTEAEAHRAVMTYIGAQYRPDDTRDTTPDQHGAVRSFHENEGAYLPRETGDHVGLTGLAGMVDRTLEADLPQSRGWNAEQTSKPWRTHYLAPKLARDYDARMKREYLEYVGSPYLEITIVGAWTGRGGRLLYDYVNHRYFLTTDHYHGVGADGQESPAVNPFFYIDAAGI